MSVWIRRTLLRYFQEFLFSNSTFLFFKRWKCFCMYCLFVPIKSSLFSFFGLRTEFEYYSPFFTYRELKHRPGKQPPPGPPGLPPPKLGFAGSQGPTWSCWGQLEVEAISKLCSKLFKSPGDLFVPILTLSTLFREFQIHFPEASASPTWVMGNV